MSLLHQPDKRGFQKVVVAGVIAGAVKRVGVRAFKCSDADGESLDERSLPLTDAVRLVVDTHRDTQ